MSDFSFGFHVVGLMSGEVGGQPTAPRRQVVAYSEVASSETPLPAGFSPVSLLGSRTGALVVGERLIGSQSEPERLVAASVRFVEAVGAALPIDKDDERVVDELMAKRAARLATRPLRRREGEPR